MPCISHVLFLMLIIRCRKAGRKWRCKSACHNLCRYLALTASTQIEHIWSNNFGSRENPSKVSCAQMYPSSSSELISRSLKVQPHNKAAKLEMIWQQKCRRLHSQSAKICRRVGRKVNRVSIDKAYFEL